MSDKYVPTIKYVTKFNDEEVIAYLEPLDRATFLMAQSETARIRGGDGAAKGREQVAAEMYNVSCKVLEKCLVKVDGLTDAANAPITKETVLDKLYFLPLANELFKELIVRASVGKATSPESEEK